MRNKYGNKIKKDIAYTRIGDKKRKRRSKFKKVVIILGFLVVLTISGVAYSLLNVQKQLTKTYVNNTPSKVSINSNKPLSILLLGVDTGDNDRGGAQSWNGNSDSQMILTLNPETKTTTIISIQRDTMTNIINSKKEVLSTQKMNAAYPLGYNENGLETAVSYAMNTISEQSGISIDNFVAMNMDGLVNLVDDVGGIDVINDSGGDIFISNTEPQYTAVVPFIGEGKSQHINGEQALVFSRDRDHLPNGDYGRSAHQREVLQALMKKMLNLNSITTYQKFIKSISNDFKTDISVDVKNLMSLMSYKDCFNKVVSIQYEGVGKMVDDASGNEISYQFIPNNVYLSIQNVLRKSINETKIQSLSSNIITYENEFGVSPDLYYLPSAVIREGEKSTEYGINPDGDFISIDEANKQEYIMSKDS